MLREFKVKEGDWNGCRDWLGPTLEIWTDTKIMDNHDHFPAQDPSDGRDRARILT